MIEYFPKSLTQKIVQNVRIMRQILTNVVTSLKKIIIYTYLSVYQAVYAFGIASIYHAASV